MSGPSDPRAALVWAKCAAYRVAECCNLAFHTRTDAYRKEAVEELADVALHLGYRLVPLAADEVAA